jgi:hypothetical protein
MKSEHTILPNPCLEEEEEEEEEEEALGNIASSPHTRRP